MSQALISLFPPLQKKTVIIGFLIAGWTFIVLLAATAFDYLSYEKFRYLFPFILLSLPVWILLESNSTPCKMDKQDEQKWTMAMMITFVCFIIVFITGILRLRGSI